MGKSDKFDVIVVGAGPAGITAAYVLAKAGLEIVLLERGPYPGSKNIFGGTLYTTVLNRIIPNFWEEAPVERHIKGVEIFLISETDALSIKVQSEEHNKPPYNNSFTVSRAKFDSWYAQKAEAAGALLITDTVVDDLIWENNKVIGVQARRDDGDIYADVVIVADGVNSLLSQKAGLRNNYAPRQVSLGIKEVIELPRGVIEDRFNLNGNEGVELKYMAGDATQGVWGGGNIYTNLESISLVTWVALKPVSERRLKVAEIMEHFKNHPFVRNYIRGGKTIEYQAHLAPDGGYESSPKYYTNGLLIAGDAARFLNASIHYEGTNFAMASGEAAAKAVLEAKKQGDYSASSLYYYQKRLNDSFVMKDLKRYRKLNRFAERNPVFFDGYLRAIAQTAADYFAVNELPKRQHEFNMIKRFRSALINADMTKKTTFPIIKFLWRSLKGGIAFI